MSFSVYLPKKPSFKRAVLNTGEFLLRIGRKSVRIGSVALFRDEADSLQRTRIEGATANQDHVYGNGHYLPVRTFGREWRLQTRV